MALPNPPSLIEYGELRFIVFEAPSDDNVPAYLAEFKKLGVRHIVRVCEPTYSTLMLETNGIRVYDWAFGDGEAPPKALIAKWRALVTSLRGEIIGVHCVAGLGRAPVLVAISLIDAGLEAPRAIEFIRARRRRAINQNQLRFLVGFAPPKNTCIVS